MDLVNYEVSPNLANALICGENNYQSESVAEMSNSVIHDTSIGGVCRLHKRYIGCSDGSVVNLT